ncbi:hypothetical protein niasHT_006095 [Heterodera trifolii]|uniref:Lon proteolytic domain-containing protein n=1 Tax=Heterodera trifolii TaxID=157864 RepID=A0ABD2M0U2_9BILA
MLLNDSMLALFFCFAHESLIPLSSYRDFLKAAFESDEAQLNSSIEELPMPRTRNGVQGPRKDDSAGEVWSNMTVGAIGGLRQKVIAATKANKRTIVLSVENAKQYKKLDKKLRNNLTAHYVDDCYELVALYL